MQNAPFFMQDATAIGQKTGQSFTAATQPIEISRPLGKGTWLAIRAGGFSGKNSRKNLFSSGKKAMSEIETVVLTTRLRSLPPAFSTASRFLNACRACALKVV